MSREPEETYSNDGPECPYCGHKHSPNEEPSFYYNEMQDTLECNGCGKTSRMSVYISHSWTCEPIEE